MSSTRPVILTVDDDRDVLGAIAADLRSQYGEHYRIVVADGGQSAIEAIDQLKIRGEALALVISDQRMPNVSGFDVLRAAKDRFADTKTVLLTAYADTEVAIDAINDLRLDYYILKPWEPPSEKLYPVVDDLLGDWHATHRADVAAIRVVGARWSAESHALRDFLQRNQIPMAWMDAETSDEGRRLLVAAGQPSLPFVVTPDGTSIAGADVDTVAAALGHTIRSEAPFHDLAIIGAGPGGLAAAVYGASEGLSTVLIEREVAGGQAGQSSRIENYLGFPTGIAGADLARRAVTQAKRFGVELLAPACVNALDLSGPYPRLSLGGGAEITCGALILACGVTYNRLELPRAEEFEGRGVYYGAAMSERDTVAGEDVVVVGGANSAGQAAMFFADHARSVTILCRADTLEAKMSSYLIEQISGRDNIVVRCASKLAALRGTDRLEGVSISTGAGDSMSVEDLDASALFIFVGASPNTAWLPPQIVTDAAGFIRTGPALGDRRFPTAEGGERDPFLYETSVPGVFAVGDIRSASIKRVASAVGEGSVAVQFIHEFLRL